MSANVPAIGLGPVPLSAPEESWPSLLTIIARSVNDLRSDRTGASGPGIPFPSAFGATPTNFLTVNFGDYPDGAEIPASVLQSYVSKIVVPSTYTQAPWPNTNFSAYSDNSNPASGGSTVNYFCLATQRNALGGAWNYNGVLSNTDPAHAIGGASLGNDFGTLIGLEINPNIWKKAAGVTPSGVIEGIRFIGGGEVVPSGGAFGLRFFPLSPGLKWSAALYTEDVATTNALDLGANGTAAANVASQTVQFRAYNGAGALTSGGVNLDASQYIRASAVNGFGVASAAAGGNIANIDGVKAAFLKPLLVGSLTQSLDANAVALFHVTTDQNLEIRGKINLADGVAIESLNDALGTLKGLELIADTLRFTVNAININGTAGVSFTGSPTASFQVINGIVVHQ